MQHGKPSIEAKRCVSCAEPASSRSCLTPAPKLPCNMTAAGQGKVKVQQTALSRTYYNMRSTDNVTPSTLCYTPPHVMYNSLNPMPQPKSHNPTFCVGTMHHFNLRHAPEHNAAYLDLQRECHAEGETAISPVKQASSRRGSGGGGISLGVKLLVLSSESSAPRASAAAAARTGSAELFCSQA